MPLSPYLKNSAAVLDNVIKTMKDPYIVGIGGLISVMVEVRISSRLRGTAGHGLTKSFQSLDVGSVGTRLVLNTRLSPRCPFSRLVATANTMPT